ADLPEDERRRGPARPELQGNRRIAVSPLQVGQAAAPGRTAGKKSGCAKRGRGAEARKERVRERAMNRRSLPLQPRLVRSRYRMRESALAIALTAIRLFDSRARVLESKPARSQRTAK